MSFLSDARSRKERKTGRKTQSVAVADRRASERFDANYPAKGKYPSKSAKMTKTMSDAANYHSMKGSRGASKSSRARTSPSK